MRNDPLKLAEELWPGIGLSEEQGRVIQDAWDSGELVSQNSILSSGLFMRRIEQRLDAY